MSLMMNKEESYLEIDAQQVAACFPNRGFKIEHNLHHCPQFELTRLAELALRLPANQVEYFSGNVGVSQDPKSHPGNGLSVEETVRRIEECGSWMVLKNVQLDPEYKRIMRDVLDEVYRVIDPSVGNLHREEAFIFISSPGSVTPYHLDEEHNFLCQVRGSKEVSMWDPQDRETISESEMEYMLQVWHSSEYHRNMSFREDFQKRATVYNLHPGEALHFPVGAPHWVKNGHKVSVSFSVTFRSALSERQAIIYFLNHKLRRLGIKPVPPWKSPWRDELKYASFQTLRRLSRIGRGRKNQTP